MYKFPHEISFASHPCSRSAGLSENPRPPEVDRDAFALLEQDFVAFNPLYREERESRVAGTYALAKRMFEEEAKGGKTTCGHQILFELESLLISSADFKLIDQRLHDLEDSIGHPSSDKPDADGMWGAFYQQWYLKLYATYDHLEAQAEDEPAPHRLPTFLVRVSTHEKITAYLDALSVSDVRHTGRDHEPEFNETLQMIVRRNPETGFWGERYRRDGREEFPDDLSMTFHVVSYLKGKVPDMPPS